jgi:hypothetical protein
MLNRIYGLFGICLLILPQAVIADDESALLLKSRGLTAEYASLLQTELKKAMSTGGPVAAIEVCRDLAPRVAQDLSNRSGARVRRTSLRTRNPDNAPDEWESRVLDDFDTGTAKEYFDESESGNARYMKAIPTAAVCLVCHGQQIAAEIKATLDAAYPQDRARNYSLGEIRGAFSITWITDASN